MARCCSAGATSSSAAGASASIDITVTVLGVGPYLNVAEISAAGQSDVDDVFGDGAGEDRDTATTSPTPAIDLSVSKTVNNAF